MNKNTVEDYKKLVKAKYEEAKTAEFSGFLTMPSPAELKKLCLVLFDKGINKPDREILDMFFEFNDKTSKRKQIEYFDVDKLRPISNFLKGKTETTRIINLDLIAVFVNFNPRPYKNFMSGNKEELTDGFVINEFSNREGVAKEDKKEVEIFEAFKKGSISKKITLALSSVLVFSLMGYGFMSIFFPNKDCLVWVKNHYEAVEYDKVKDVVQVSPYNQTLLDNFKKITVCDTTTFFRNGNYDIPQVWYGKSPNKEQYEYFNQPGLHPVTGKTLKPITKYIIEKYIRKPSY